MFTVEELFSILNDSRILESRKKPFVNFLHHVYVCTASGQATNSADLSHNR